MKSFKLLPRLLVGFGLLLFTSIIPISVQAAINITSSTLNGASSVSVAPSATISANVVLTSTSGTDWSSTSWNINGGSFKCVNHSNHTSSGNYNETFNITALAAAGTYNVVFRAHTNDGCSSGTVTRTMTNAVTVVVSPPILTAATKTVAENSPAGTNVGTALTATNSPLGYTITGGTGAALFNISTTGQITVKSGAVLDFETTPSYTLLVKATNAGGDSNIATITVNLTNVLTPLVTAGQSFTLMTGTLNGTVIGTVATTVTTPTAFTITGSNFAISSTGVITVANSSGLTVGSGTYTVNASTSEGGDSKPITIVVTQRSSNLGLTNTDSVDPVITNASYTYTLGISNTGPDDATELVLTDTLPVGVTYVSAVGTGWSCTEAGGLVVCTKASLANAASSSVVITVLAPVIASTITNTATVISSGTDVNPVNNTDIEQSTTVEGRADLRIVKTGPASVITNNTIQYTLSVTNLGPSATDNITVSDTLPVGVGYQVYSGNDWICSYTAGTRLFSCTHPTTLAINATSAITLVTTAPNTAGSVTNTATVTGPLTDLVPGNNTSSVTTTITAASYANANVRPFALFRQDNINGDIQMIGNSVMETSTGACAPATTNNNNLNTRYADKDSDATTTLNSTSADLKLPAGVRSDDIQYAMLYWQGRTTGTSQIINGRTVKIKPYGMVNYQTVTTSDTKFNWINTDYQGAVEVTTLIKNSLDAVGTATLDATGYNKPLWVGDVFANQLGSNSNGFGTWSLIIAYKDSNAKLRNISTYDGYDAVYKNTKQAVLSGFLTPSAGVVDSKFLVFAGEGDVSLDDSATLTNASNAQVSLGSNVFKSIEDINGINVTARNPNCANTIGADIRTFSIGTNGSPSIIGNSQTTTTVRLTSPNNDKADQYFPGAFAFSTELYVPRVCYNESVTYNDLPISATNTPVSGNRVEYTVTITNQDAEDADGVFVEKEFDTPSQISFATSSMQVAPIPGTAFSAKTDRVGDDTAEYSSASKTAKFLLGTGAAWYQGGTILQNQQTKFKYKAKVGTEDVQESGYKISYRNDLLHLTFNGISAPKCVDFNNSFSVVVPDGTFDAWETTIAGTPPAQEDRKIHTKIVNKPVTLKVGALDALNASYQNYTSGLVGWRVVDASNCPAGGDNVTGWADIDLSTNPKEITFTPTQVYADVQIQFAPKQMDGTYSAVTRNCSSDNFAIRPNNFASTLTPNQSFTAGTAQTLTFRADAFGGTTGTPGYNETENGSFIVDIFISDSTKVCPEPNLHFIPELAFTNGAVTNNYKLRNVGDFNVTIEEISGGEFALVDALDTLDLERFIAPYTQTIKVIPDNFEVNASLTNGSNGFTYLSNYNAYPTTESRNISASLDLNITARASDNIPTSNYASTCYAKNGNISIDINAFNMTPANAVTQMLWYETNSATTGILAIPTTNFVVPISSSTFAFGGLAPVSYLLNFNRSQTLVVNPSSMVATNITATDADAVTGSRVPAVNSDRAYFVYGRVIPRDVRVFGANTPFTANAWYEVFNTTAINGVGLPISRNDPIWSINTLHSDANDGDANVAMVIAPNAVAYGGGIETYNYGGQAIGGYVEHISTAPWLWNAIGALGYSDPANPANLNCLTHPCFKINVVPAVGATGSAKSTNEDGKDSKTSTSTGWRSASDYAPAAR